MNTNPLNTTPLNSPGGDGGGIFLTINSEMSSGSEGHTNKVFIMRSMIAHKGVLHRLPFPLPVDTGVMSISSTVHSEYFQMFVSAMAAKSEVGSQITSSMSFHQAVDLISEPSLPYMMDIAEALGAIASSSIRTYKRILQSSSMVLGGELKTEAELHVNVAAVMTLLDIQTYGSDLEYFAGLGIGDTFAHHYRSVIEAHDALAGEADEQVGKRVSMLLFSSASKDTKYESSLSAKLLLESTVGALATIKLGDDIYEGWVLHAGDLAFTKYTNYPFTGITEHQGRYYGVSDGGVYELEGDTDSGEPIQASVKTGLLALGTRAIKDAKALYLGYTSQGDIVLKVTTTGGGKKREDWYKMKPSNAESMRTGRFVIQRGLRASYWQFELCNTDGSDFEIDDATLVYRVLSRRIR